jgi:hypothetical protein
LQNQYHKKWNARPIGTVIARNFGNRKSAPETVQLCGFSFILSKILSPGGWQTYSGQADYLAGTVKKVPLPVLLLPVPREGARSAVRLPLHLSG